MFKLLLLVAFVPAVMLQNADDLPHGQWDRASVRACTKGQPLPNAVRVENCPNDVCQVRLGGTAYMAMDFTANQESSDLTVKATPFLLGIALPPHTLPEKVTKACNWLHGTRCPVSMGEDITYVLEFELNENYPTISLEIEIDLVNQAGTSQGCFGLKISVIR